MCCGIPGDVESDLINEALFLIVIPLILIPSTICICLLAGLPLYIFPKLNAGIRKFPYIAFIGMSGGILMLYLSQLPAYMEEKIVWADGKEIIKNIVSENLFYSAWFVTAFFMLHFYPIDFLNFVFDKFKSRKNIDWDEEVKIN